MQKEKTTLVGRAVLATLATFSISIVAAGQQGAKPGQAHDMRMMGTSSMTPAQKIANATSAAPASVSAQATVLDWPVNEGDQLTSLRAGSNGWSCLPDMPETKGDDPMCVDETWMQWFQAYMTKTAPAAGHVGIGYMAAPGGGWGSNTDPYAMTEMAGNHWAFHPPHLMIIVPDPKSLAGLSTDPNNGGPYVMYAGTPYAHIMAPVVPPAMTGK